MKDNAIDAFFALLRVGLWEDAGSNYNIILDLNEKEDWNDVYKLAEEQSVIGVVLAGIEHSNVKPPQERLLQWIGEVQMLEQQNKSMNQFIAELVEMLRKADIYTLLVKGQGIAQCYKRPLWRACGDVDLLLSDSNYEKAKSYLLKYASSIEPEVRYIKHLGMTIDNWEVELHGNLRGWLLRSIDDSLDEIQYDVFCGGNVRSWLNGKTQIFLPGVNNDVMFIFAHILQHLYKGGIGLKQVCDWCRLLWAYRNKIDHKILEVWINKMGVLSEWKSFGVLAVNYLGMPKEAMPYYDSSQTWCRNADIVASHILGFDCSGFKNNNNNKSKLGSFSHKLETIKQITQDCFLLSRAFPKDSFWIWLNTMRVGLTNHFQK